MSRVAQSGGLLAALPLLALLLSCDHDAPQPDPTLRSTGEPLRLLDARLDPELHRKLPRAPQRVVISYDHPPGEAEEAAVERWGGVVLRRWSGVAWAILAELTPNGVKTLLAEDRRVREVRLDGGGSGGLANAIQQAGTRRVHLGEVGGVEYTGAGVTIAVADSGVDGTHADLAGRVAGWVDLQGPEGGAPGSYEEPTDRHGHGTGVSSIAVGSGAGASEGGFALTISSRLPEAEGQGVLTPFPMRVLDPSQELRLIFDPVEPVGGTHLVWLLDPQRELLSDVLSDDDPVVVAFTSEVFGAPQADPNHALAVFSAPLDGVDTAGIPFEGQIEVPFAPFDANPVTAGAAPGARLFGIKALTDRNSFQSAQDVLDLIEWLDANVEQEGIDVVNMSLNFYRGGPNLAVDDALDRFVLSHGVPVTVSARNGQEQGIAVASPATAAEVIAVGALSVHDEVAVYSSLGGVDEERIKPDLLAPGGSGVSGPIVIADSNQAPCKRFAPTNCGLSEDAFADDYTVWSGTSFAAPHVAGVLALLLEAAEARGVRDAITPSHLYALLYMTATEVQGGERESPGPPGRAEAPKDRTEGYGRLNSVAALEAMSLSWDEEVPIVVTLGGGLGERRAWARRVTLSPGFQLDLVATGPDDMDVDLHVYDTDPGEHGAPVVIAASAAPDLATEEVTVVSAEAEREVIVVLKRIAGEGDVSIARWIGPEACDAPDAERLGEACRVGVGDCEREGTLVCAQDGASLTCTALGVPSGEEELCGGGDEDCDGEVDEGYEDLGAPCVEGVGACRREDVRVCDDARTAAVCGGEPISPGDELCGDDIDNDCDGEADEGFASVGDPCEVGVGACLNAGRLTCDPLEPAREPVCDASPGESGEELCGSGEDEDCDGEVDEGFEAVREPCEVGEGACAAAGELICAEDGLGLRCDASPGAPGEELCLNAADEDCDGEVDEGFEQLGEACRVGDGRCAAEGVLTCEPGTRGVACDASPGEPGDELCGSGEDEDCDGEVDEGFRVGEACSVGSGECRRAGVWTCGEGGVGEVCVSDAPEPVEACGDGLDNDCDGDIDEGCADGDVGHDGADAGHEDASAGRDDGGREGDAATGDGGGCGGCAVSEASGGAPWWWLVWLGLAAWRRRVL